MLAIIMAIEDETDRTFVESVYNMYSEKMYLLAMDIINNHYDAQDCVHETIVKIIDNLDRFKQADKENYLIKLIVIACRNTAINKYNANKKRNRTEISTTMKNDDAELETVDIPDLSENVEKLVLSEFACNYLKQLIDKLDPKYRDVVILKSLGFDNDEISCIINISPDLVRKRYSRARAKLLEMGGDKLYEYRN